MTEQTRNNTSTAQASEAAQDSFLDVLTDIENAWLTSEALRELCHRLSSVEKALGRYALTFSQSGSCNLNIQVFYHLRMSILSSHDACTRYRNAFKERIDE
jgi:hypothetical protein